MKRTTRAVLQREGEWYLLMTVKENETRIILIPGNGLKGHWTLYKKDLFLHFTWDTEGMVDKSDRRSFMVDTNIIDGEEISHNYEGNIMLEGKKLDTDKGIMFSAFNFNEENFWRFRRFEKEGEADLVILPFDRAFQLNVVLSTDCPVGWEMVKDRVARLNDGRSFGIFVKNVRAE